MSTTAFRPSAFLNGTGESSCWSIATSRGLRCTGRAQPQRTNLHAMTHSRHQYLVIHLEIGRSTRNRLLITMSTTALFQVKREFCRRSHLRPPLHHRPSAIPPPDGHPHSSLQPT